MTAPDATGNVSHIHGGGEHHGPSFKDAFTQKIGPFPVIVWALGIVAVGGGAYWLYKRSHPSTAAATTSGSITGGTSDDGTQSGGVSTDSSGGWSANDATNSSGTSSTGTSTTSTAPQVFTDNTSWSTNAANGMIGSGSDPTVVSSALSKYLLGQTLTSAEQSIVNAVLIRYGTPPEGVIAPVAPPAGTASGTGVATTPTPTKTVTPTPAPKGPANNGRRQYTIQKGDTIGIIATKMYGSGAAKYENSLRVENPWLKGHAVSQPLVENVGTVISVPPVS